MNLPALLSIASITFALLVDEILLSSIFHVLIGAGNTAAAISVALLGLSAAGVTVYLSPRFRDRERAGELYPKLQFWFGVALMTSTFVIMSVPINQMEVSFSRGETAIDLLIFATYLAATIPFFIGGLAINVILFRHSDSISRIYFADLAGAALGCLASPFMLYEFGAPRGALYAALPAVVLGWRVARRTSRLDRFAIVGPIGLLLLAHLSPAAHSFRTLGTMGDVQSPSYRSIAISEGDIAFERWALDAWTVIRSDHIPQQWEPFGGWGLSPRFDGAVPRTLLINYNARFSTYVTEYAGDLAPLSEWLDADLISLHYLLGRDFDSALVMGAGGGREVLNALHHGVERVVAVDVSDVVIEDLMKDHLREFSGDLYFDDRVEALADEGRSFAERTDEEFDLIDFSIVGGMNLEKMDLVRIDDLFTLEALSTYFDRISDQGLFSYVMYTLRSDLVDEQVEHGAVTGIPYVPAIKTLTGVRMVLEERVAGLDFSKHVLIAGLRGVVVDHYDLLHIMASPTPFDEAARSRFLDLCRELDFIPIYPRPPEAPAGESRLYTSIVESPALQSVADSAPFSIWPATDDSPFHYAFDESHARRALERGNFLTFLAGNPLISAGVALSLLGVLVTVTPLLWIFASGGQRLSAFGASLRRSWSLLLLFGFVGYGYMAVEIAVLLKLQLYLGKPIYGLAVGLFSFLLSSGLGSNFTARFDDATRQPVFSMVTGVVVLGLLFYMLGGILFGSTMAIPLWARILISVAAIFPLAFFMGMLFPAGIKLIVHENAELVPWAWAINGCLSVVGIFGTRIAALFLGFDRALLIGLASYATVALCMLLYTRTLSRNPAIGAE